MKDKKNKKKQRTFMLTFSLVIIGLWLLSILITHLFVSPENRGVFGDSFGGINALFSGFAFLGIIYTIFLQRNELRLQRKELKMTRNELLQSRVAQQESSSHFSEQNRLSVLPYLKVGYVPSESGRNGYLEIVNSSKNAAFDIAVEVYFHLADGVGGFEDFDPHEILKSYNSSQEEFLLDFTVYETGEYPVLNTLDCIRIPNYFKNDSNGFSLLINFRDSLGNNYCQYFSLLMKIVHFKSEYEYYLYEITPNPPEVHDRIPRIGEDATRAINSPHHSIRQALKNSEFSYFINLLPDKKYLKGYPPFYENRWSLIEHKVV